MVEEGDPTLKEDHKPSHEKEEGDSSPLYISLCYTTSKRKHNIIIFIVVAAGWLLFDIVTKGYFNTFTLGEVIGKPWGGLFRFHLIHNTGAAWGIFDQSTLFLGILSVVVCILLVVYLAFLPPTASLAQVIGLALVCAGGIGNALDRFLQGYVVDFIEFTFIDFPVFNIADIGVTCGSLLFFFALLFGSYRNRKNEV